MNTKSLKVSVTALADFSCRVGDLELSGAAGPTARQGMKAHQRIQSQRTVDSEVRLSTSITILDVDVILSGRVDLLDTVQHRISEIKTTLVPAHRLSESKLALQWAQITLYGFCYYQHLMKDGLVVPADGIELELIHADIRAESESSDVRKATLAELESFAQDALVKYVEWHKMLWHWQARATSTALAMTFPYEQYRSGQRDMAAAIFRSVRDGETLLCEAPTGTGKTLSSLFPVIKSLGEGQIKHAAYLTAKTSGRESAMSAVRTLQKSGLEITSVMIRSKSPTCFCSNGRCERDDQNVCPMTIGFFDRLPAAREEAMSIGVVDGECLDKIAWDHQVCPFELALQLLPWVTLIIADFNYVFDPLVRIGRFNESRRDTALLIDEAHNLVDRARGMHSGFLNRTELNEARLLIADSHPFLAKKIKSLTNSLLRSGDSVISAATAKSDLSSSSMHGSSAGFKSTSTPESIQESAPNSDSVSALAPPPSPTYIAKTDFDQSNYSINDEVPKKLLKLSSEVVDAFMQALDQGPAVPEALFDMFKMLCRFVAISELYGDEHKTVIQVEKSGSRTQVIVNLKCLDAAKYLQPQYSLFKSTIVFSATLRPAPFYRDALGLVEDTQQLVIGSPFSPDQVRHIVVSYINTRYRHRSTSIPELLAVLNAMVESKAGNYMVFFPSYAYLELVYKAFSEKYPKVITWQQPRNTDNETRQQLLEQLELKGTRLGFAILGGVFGEGIDYVGDLLVGVVIVGTGLPGIGVEQDLIADCYRKQGLDGFDYAYRYPGFTKVLQTAGRVIRTETDRGVVILIDDRFGQSFYRNIFPSHWQIEPAKALEDIENKLNLFWDSQQQLLL